MFLWGFESCPELVGSGLALGPGNRAWGCQSLRGERSREKVGGHEAPASASSMVIGCLMVLAAANSSPTAHPCPVLDALREARRAHLLPLSCGAGV